MSSNTMKHATLKRRILVPVSVISLVALLGGGAVLVAFVNQQVSRALKLKEATTSAVLESSVGPILAAGDVAKLGEFVRELESDPDIANVTFYDVTGKPLAQSQIKNTKEEKDWSLVERKIAAADSKPLGSFRLAFSPANKKAAIMGLIALVGACILVIQGVLIFALIRIFKSVHQTMRDVVGDLRDAAITISVASDTLTSSSSHLSKGVSRQAAAVQETVASMAEMSSMIAQTSTNATHCNRLSDEVTEKTVTGTRVMGDMVASMSAIESANERLHEIRKIIQEIAEKTNVINDIVFKTQLLSLNASIEAARAGQQGRGFAVVAEEVGNLAQMSGKSAKEISDLLVHSIQAVEEILKSTQETVTQGRNVSTTAADTFGEISKDVEAIARQIQSISEATRQQQEGVKQSSDAMVSVDETAQSNNAIAKEAEEAATLLATQSSRIKETIEIIGRITFGT